VELEERKEGRGRGGEGSKRKDGREGATSAKQLQPWPHDAFLGS